MQLHINVSKGITHEILKVRLTYAIILLDPFSKPIDALCGVMMYNDMLLFTSLFHAILSLEFQEKRESCESISVCRSVEYTRRFTSIYLSVV